MISFLIILTFINNSRWLRFLRFCCGQAIDGDLGRKPSLGGRWRPEGLTDEGLPSACGRRPAEPGICSAGQGSYRWRLFLIHRSAIPLPPGEGFLGCRIRVSDVRCTPLRVRFVGDGPWTSRKLRVGIGLRTFTSPTAPTERERIAAPVCALARNDRFWGEPF